MRRIQLLAVPYDSGHRGVRMGAGPLDLLAHGAETRARALAATLIEARNPWRSEVATSFELAGLLARSVRETIDAGLLPVVLAGNCSTALGTIGGTSREGGLGVLWLDAHADLNTPETSQSGFLDGMALAVATGRCWKELAAGIPGFAPVADPRVALVGTRDLDPPEAAILERAAVQRVSPADTGAMQTVLGNLERAGTRQLYVHVDLDVHDPATCRANGYAVEGGLTLEQTLDVIGMAARAFPLAALAITAYDPAAGDEGRAREVALRILERIAELA